MYGEKSIPGESSYLFGVRGEKGFGRLFSYPFLQWDKWYKRETLFVSRKETKRNEKRRKETKRNEKKRKETKRKAFLSYPDEEGLFYNEMRDFFAETFFGSFRDTKKVSHLIVNPKTL